MSSVRPQTFEQARENFKRKESVPRPPELKQEQTTTFKRITQAECKQEKFYYKHQTKKERSKDRDVYFVKLVAGALKRDFEAMIERTSCKDEKVVPYTYGEELLFAWATVIEKVKKMIFTVYDTSSELHEDILRHDGVTIAFARYVAFVIMTETNFIVPRNRTRFVLATEAETEDTIVVDLMTAIHDEMKCLHEDLYERFVKPDYNN